MRLSSRTGSPLLPKALMDLSGTVLERRYEVGRLLGSGGMGAVFEARHLRLDREVAVKVLWPSFAMEEEYVERFFREAKSASKIRHRNVVEILDYGEAAGGLLYSVMELLVGRDLQELLESNLHGRLPWVQACELLVQIASGLKAAHARGVIHRDIKPANCFLNEEDDESVIKLVDFGVAKLTDKEAQPLTGVAQVLGTPSYIAPEMVRTQTPANPRTDIYALGVLAYRMLVGRTPFEANTFFELVHKACSGSVPSMREQVPSIPPAAEAFILEMLAKDPEDRPPDMVTVRDRLIALSRETLGPQAVELRGSGQIRLTPKSGPPAIALDDTVASWEGVKRNETPRSSAPEPVTEVLYGRDEDEPMADLAVLPVPSSLMLPPPSEEMIPMLGDTTLRLRAGAAVPIERRPNRGWRVLALGAVGVLAGLGALMGSAMLGDDTTDGEVRPAEVAEAPDDDPPRSAEVPSTPVEEVGLGAGDLADPDRRATPRAE